MPQLVLRGHESQPVIELLGASVGGVATRLLVCAGQLEVSVDQPGGPARIAGMVRFLVQGAPSLPATADLSTARVSVTVHLLGVTPIAQSDARALVLGARAGFVADGRGGVSLGVEVSLEALYLAPPAAMRLAYQVTATAPAG